MKKPTKNIIEESDMSHEEERRVEKPFFKKKYWRKAVLDSLSMIESEIIGRPFSMDLHDAGDDFHIFINPDYGNNVGKSFSFFLEKNSLFYKNEAIKKYK
ncbi:MAG: hypothetical protein O3B87_01700 [bacterium]|nr:hypothetical protein [bacterium]